MLLRKEGVESDMTENGQMALELLVRDVDAYQMILMDNLMPVMVRLV